MKEIVMCITEEEGKKMERYQKNNQNFIIKMKNNKGKLLWSMEWDFNKKEQDKAGKMKRYALLFATENEENAVRVFELVISSFLSRAGQKTTLRGDSKGNVVPDKYGMVTEAMLIEENVVKDYVREVNVK